MQEWFAKSWWTLVFGFVYACFVFCFVFVSFGFGSFRFVSYLFVLFSFRFRFFFVSFSFRFRFVLFRFVLFRFIPFRCLCRFVLKSFQVWLSNVFQVELKLCFQVWLENDVVAFRFAFVLRSPFILFRFASLHHETKCCPPMLSTYFVEFANDAIEFPDTYLLPAPIHHDLLRESLVFWSSCDLFLFRFVSFACSRPISLVLRHH